MDGETRTIVWFRRDLRIEDNPALAAAARDGSVFPVYIWCPKEEGQFFPGRVSRWWLKNSLAQLEKSLTSLGAPLAFIKTQDTFTALLECVKAVGATKVVFNHLYDPVSLVRDHEIKQKLAEVAIPVRSYNGDLLYEPWEVYDEKGHAFTTFDAYWQKCMSLPMEPVAQFPPWHLVSATGTIQSCSVEELGLEHESEKSSNALLGRGWSPGWSSADKALSDFIELHLHEYSKSRLKVGGNSTSLLSPYLHFGELSIRKVFQCVQLKHILYVKEENILGKESANLYLKAIGFREYSRYLCFNFPFTLEQPLLRNLKFFPWNPNMDRFKAWRQGRTGYPLVDAGMRELWATGWLHNRIRVIVSSFCVKYLLLPWRWGMKYFWDTLLDADLESDILGWQYISGSLPDGHELDRLDNPEIQGAKYDPEGEYVRQWLPELARMPSNWIHHPWNAPLTVLQSAGVELGLNYPKPIIEIDEARESLTKAIFTMWERESSARAGSTNGTSEEVHDNSENFELPIPTVILSVKAAGSTASSRDQRVPSFQPVKNNPISRKRSKNIYDEEAIPGKLPNHNKAGPSKEDEEDSWTAESSYKKQATSSSFSVPHSWMSSSTGNLLQDCEHSDPVQASEELNATDQCPSKMGE
uniref:Photolyase/cryptochrome alpha/beta domain-containing protein n=1 Tax=Kalanchoe fedtschenkoi TaxID=63787 RepID=A0A7N0UUS9_KALFE